jgi:hypothetical protein
MIKGKRLILEQGGKGSKTGRGENAYRAWRNFGKGILRLRSSFAIAKLLYAQDDKNALSCLRYWRASS